MISRVCAVAALLALLAACGGEDGDRRRRSSRDFSGGGGGAGGGAAEAKTYDPSSGGVVSGKVTFQGTAPEREVIRMAADPTCSASHTDEVLTEKVVVNGNGTLRNCFVYVNVNDRYAPLATAAELDQKGCVYLPHVVGVMSGQDFKVKNSDNTLHNIHWIAAENGEQNFGMAKPGQKTKQFDYPEMGIRVKCDVHPWMGGWIHVMSHPFFASTGDDGTFEIRGVPAGTHTLTLWHEVEGYRGQQTVTVTAGQAATADFTVNG